MTSSSYDCPFSASLVIAVLILAVNVCFLPNGVEGASLVFQEGFNGYSSTQDTLVQGSPFANQSYGNLHQVVINVGTPLDDDQGLLRFDNLFGAGPNQIPLGSNTITSAKLDITVSDPATTLERTHVHQMLAPWSESSTWNSMNNGISADGVEAVATPIKTLDEPFSTGKIFSIDVTESLSAWQSGAPNYGWAFLADGTPPDGWSFHSSDSSALAARPKLTVEYRTLSSGDDLAPQPQEPVPSHLPTAKNLVLYTHGHRTDSVEFTSGYWADLGTALQGQVGTDPDWEIVALDWTDRNQNSLPGTSLNQANSIGAAVGKLIAAGDYEHVHLIAHSAGSGLVNNAAKAINHSNALGLTDTAIHTTFLDPYAPTVFERGSSDEGYGVFSDWSDNYSARDVATGYPREDTYPLLKYSHNVDVTEVSIPGETYISTDLEQGHGWPIEFYVESITNPKPTWNGYGFGLSLEAGGWSATHPTNFPADNDWVFLEGGTATGSFMSSVRLDSPQDVESLPHATSSGVLVSGSLIDVSTFSPGWISVLLDFEEPVNLITFDAEFISEIGAEGLLAMYWDGEVVSTVDERFALPGSNTYTMWLPSLMQPGTYELAFRLDPFTEVQSQVFLDNIQTGFVGVPEPSSLALLLISGLILSIGRSRTVCVAATSST